MSLGMGLRMAHSGCWSRTPRLQVDQRVHVEENPFTCFFWPSYWSKEKLTAEGFISPRANGDSAVLTFIDISLNGFAQDGPGSAQLTQIEDTVFEVILKSRDVVTSPFLSVLEIVRF